MRLACEGRTIRSHPRIPMRRARQSRTRRLRAAEGGAGTRTRTDGGGHARE